MQQQRGNVTVLQQRIDRQEKDLDARRAQVGRLLYGMIRMQRLPRHYVLGQPEDTETLLRTASALNVTYGASEQEFAALLYAHKQLMASRASLQQEEDALNAQKAQFAQKETELRETMSARRNFHKKLGIETLTRRAGSLKDLLDGLAEEKAFFASLEPTLKPSVPASTAFASRKGQMQLPEGSLKYTYGQKVEGETRRGLTLLTPAQTLITALHGGRVVFAGNFMDYGNMVIVQHDNGWHSVVAGMDVIYVEPGESVRQDATLGVMGETPDARELYVELRKGSKPVDPAPWMRKVRRLADSR
jgi:septal ring factor EnvC (AmiA/AmiB activator)